MLSILDFPPEILLHIALFLPIEHILAGDRLPTQSHAAQESTNHNRGKDVSEITSSTTTTTSNLCLVSRTFYELISSSAHFWRQRCEIEYGAAYVTNRLRLYERRSNKNNSMPSELAFWQQNYIKIYNRSHETGKYKRASHISEICASIRKKSNSTSQQQQHDSWSKLIDFIKQQLLHHHHYHQSSSTTKTSTNMTPTRTMRFAAATTLFTPLLNRKKNLSDNTLFHFIVRHAPPDDDHFESLVQLHVQLLQEAKRRHEAAGRHKVAALFDQDLGFGFYLHHLPTRVTPTTITTLLPQKQQQHQQDAPEQVPSTLTPVPSSRHPVWIVLEHRIQDAKILEVMLKYGANVNTCRPDLGGQTPIMFAVSSMVVPTNYYPYIHRTWNPMVDTILTHSRVRVNLDAMDVAGNNVFHYAATAHDAQVMKSLLSYYYFGGGGASSSRSKSSREFTDNCDDKQQQIDAAQARNVGGFTPFHLLARSADGDDIAECAEIMFEYGLDPGATNQRDGNRTAFHYLMSDARVKLPSVLFFTETYGANVHSCRDDQGNTPLHIYLRHRGADEKILSHFLQKDPVALAAVRNGSGETYLTTAINNFNWKAAEFLVRQAHCDINERFALVRTPPCEQPATTTTATATTQQEAEQEEQEEREKAAAAAAGVQGLTALEHFLCKRKTFPGYQSHIEFLIGLGAEYRHDVIDKIPIEPVPTPPPGIISSTTTTTTTTTNNNDASLSSTRHHRYHLDLNALRHFFANHVNYLYKINTTESIRYAVDGLTEHRLIPPLVDPLPWQNKSAVDEMLAMIVFDHARLETMMRRVMTLSWDYLSRGLEVLVCLLCYVSRGVFYSYRSKYEEVTRPAVIEMLADAIVHHLIASLQSSSSSSVGSSSNDNNNDDDDAVAVVVERVRQVLFPNKEERYHDDLVPVMEERPKIFPPAQVLHGVIDRLRQMQHQHQHLEFEMRDSTSSSSRSSLGLALLLLEKLRTAIVSKGGIEALVTVVKANN